MSRELFKSMVYKDGKVYTRQCSNNVNPKNYSREENKGLTRLYQEKGEQDFEKFFITNLLLEGTVEVLNGSNKEFIKLRNKEDEIFTNSLHAKTEEEKSNVHLEYKNIKEDIANYVSSFYDNHTRLNKNIERSR